MLGLLISFVGQPVVEICSRVFQVRINKGIYHSNYKEYVIKVCTRK